MEKKKKLIIVTSRGPIRAKSSICGPITMPFMEETKTIFRIISEGHTVLELLEDGTKLQLDASNFNSNNNVKKPIPVIEPKQTKEPEPVVQPQAANDDATKKNFNKYDKYDKNKKFDKKNNSYHNINNNTNKEKGPEVEPVETVTEAPAPTEIIDTLELK